LKKPAALSFRQIYHQVVPVKEKVQGDVLSGTPGGQKCNLEISQTISVSITTHQCNL